MTSLDMLLIGLLVIGLIIVVVYALATRLKSVTSASKSDEAKQKSAQDIADGISRIRYAAIVWGGMIFLLLYMGWALGVIKW